MYISYIGLLFFGVSALYMAFIFFKQIDIFNEFREYMEHHHANEWKEMCKRKRFIDEVKPYSTKAIHKFMWSSSETFGDENIKKYRKKVRSGLLLFIIPIIFFILCIATVIIIVLLSHPELCQIRHTL